MRTNDQYFKPGDKIIRVAGNRSQECLYKATDAPTTCPVFGEVYCVADFWEGPECNVLIVVGGSGWRYANGMKVGYPASAFRKVEEIKLCTKAAEHFKQTEVVK